MTFSTKFRWVVVCFITLIISANAKLFAQGAGITITGVVSDTTGGLPGVLVTEQGTKNGVQTSVDGAYTITVKDENAVLTFNSLGMGMQTRRVGTDRTINISLTVSKSQNLEDVVVVGYGTQKRTSLTDAVSTITAKTFQDRGPIASPLAALQGQVPGVAITRSSAQPGRESWNFSIRGASSANGSEPLIIVDGLTLPNAAALNSFNPNDIDNISFLKDAAAASIYGSRAAGGVVLITTKRAKSGKPMINFNSSVSRKIVGLQPKLVDATGWGPMIEEARRADGFTNDDIWVKYAMLNQYAVKNNITHMTNAEALAGLTGLGLSSAGFFTDVKDFTFFPGTMQDILWGNATSTEQQLSIAGKTEKAGYRVSLGYLNDGSLLKVGNNANKRYNFRLSHEYQFSEKLKLNTNVSLEKNDIVQPSNIGAVLNNGIQPGLPLASENGKPYIWGSGIANATPNNIAIYGGDNKEYNARINAGFNLTYDIVKHLRAVATVGYYHNQDQFKTQENLINWYEYSGTSIVSSLTPSGSSRGFYQRLEKDEDYYNLNGYLEYANTVAKNHDIRVMAGTTYERDEQSSFYARAYDVLNGVPTSLANSTATDAAGKTMGESNSHYALGGYFGRINYSYKNKYLFQANSRVDGSSRFTEKYRWKGFYGVSGGWRISQEDFMKNVRPINDLKLRASYGNVGNQSGIGLYEYAQLLNLTYSTGATAANYPIIGTSPVVRVSPANILAPDRTWERISTSNLALDFVLINNHLSGSVEYFIKDNNNMLIGRTLPDVLGGTPPAGNFGHLRTKGWEISLNWRGKVGELTYHIGGNIADFQNKLLNINGGGVISSNNRGLNSNIEGYPLNSYFGLEYAGRIQTQEQLDDYRKYVAGSNVLPQGAAGAQANGRLALGDNMYKDVNGDGKITFPEDAVFLGTDDPRYIYSFNGGFEWKGFDFNCIFQGVGKRTIIRDGNWRIPGAVIFQAQNEAYLNQWWTADHTDAALPRISTTGTINNYNYYPSNFVTQNGAYLRLKNIVLGYSLPQHLTERFKIQRLRIYVSGNDLWEVTHINDGWDPEASRTVNNTGDASNNNINTYSGRYPFYRNVTFGANLTF